MKSTKDLNKLLEEVTQDVVDLLAKSEGAPLAKADPGEETPGEATPGGSSTEGSSPAEGSPAEETPPPADAPAPGDEQTQDPAQDASADPQALVAEYAKLPPEELKLHFMACHAALMQAMGGDEGSGEAPAGSSAGGPPPGAEASAPPAEQSPSVQKAEIKAPAANGGTSKPLMAKSEIEVRLDTLEKGLKDKDAEIEARDQTIRQLEEKLDQAVTGLTGFLQRTTGLRKSISGVSFDKKPGDEPQFKEMSKSEAIAKLNQLTADPKMKSEDRKLVNQYVIGGAPQSTVAHLLGLK